MKKAKQPSKILRLMDRLINEQPDDKEKGVFLMSEKTLKLYRKAVGNFTGIYKGHKVRTLNGVSDTNLYLMSENEYESLKINIIENIKKQTVPAKPIRKLDK